MKLISVLLAVFVLLCPGWSMPPLTGNPGTSVIMLNLSGRSSKCEKAFFEELKKDNAHLGIHYFMHAGANKNEANVFFKTHRLPIRVSTFKNHIQLTANDGNIFFCTPQKLVIIIIKNEKLYYFFDDPLTGQNRKGIKQELNHLSSLMTAYYNYWSRA